MHNTESDNRISFMKCVSFNQNCLKELLLEMVIIATVKVIPKWKAHFRFCYYVSVNRISLSYKLAVMFQTKETNKL